MQTRTLKTLLRIAESGSFSTAANQLNMTLSTVSMQMATLEAELDVQLFDRSFRPPRLTAAGRSVCRHAQRVVAAESDLLEACSGTDILSGSYRIGFVPTASIRLLPDFLISAANRAGKAHFDIQTGLSELLESRVLSGQLDAAVLTPSPVHDVSLDYRVLRREPFAYAVSLSVSDLDTAQLFETLPFFHFLPQSGIGRLIALRLRERGLRSSKPVFLDSVEAIMECVNNGIGFTLLPKPDIERYGSDRIRVLESTGHRELALVTRKGTTTRTITDEIQSLFED